MSAGSRLINSAKQAVNMVRGEKTRMELAIDAMRALQKDGSDPEKNAAIAEGIIKQMLVSLGCRHLVSEWDKVERY